MNAKRTDRLRRDAVPLERPELTNGSEDLSDIQDETFNQLRTIPAERRPSIPDLVALLRWEDDGGQTF